MHAAQRTCFEHAATPAKRAVAACSKQAHDQEHHQQVHQLRLLLRKAAEIQEGAGCISGYASGLYNSYHRKRLCRSVGVVEQ